MYKWGHTTRTQSVGAFSQSDSLGATRGLGTEDQYTAINYYQRGTYSEVRSDLIVTFGLNTFFTQSLLAGDFNLGLVRVATSRRYSGESFRDLSVGSVASYYEITNGAMPFSITSQIPVLQAFWLHRGPTPGGTSNFTATGLLTRRRVNTLLPTPSGQHFFDGGLLVKYGNVNEATGPNFAVTGAAARSPQDTFRIYLENDAVDEIYGSDGSVVEEFINQPAIPDTGGGNRGDVFIQIDLSSRPTPTEMTLNPSPPPRYAELPSFGMVDDGTGVLVNFGNQPAVNPFTVTAPENEANGALLTGILENGEVVGYDAARDIVRIQFDSPTRLEVPAYAFSLEYFSGDVATGWLGTTVGDPRSVITVTWVPRQFFQTVGGRVQGNVNTAGSTQSIAANNDTNAADEIPSGTIGVYGNNTMNQRYLEFSVTSPPLVGDDANDLYTPQLNTNITLVELYETDSITQGADLHTLGTPRNTTNFPLPIDGSWLDDSVGIDQIDTNNVPEEGYFLRAVDGDAANPGFQPVLSWEEVTMGEVNDHRLVEYSNINNTYDRLLIGTDQAVGSNTTVAESDSLTWDNATGTLAATEFSGSGSGLTNVGDRLISGATMVSYIDENVTTTDSDIDNFVLLQGGTGGISPESITLSTLRTNLSWVSGQRIAIRFSYGSPNPTQTGVIEGIVSSYNANTSRIVVDRIGTAWIRTFSSTETSVFSNFTPDQIVSVGTPGANGRDGRNGLDGLRGPQGFLGPFIAQVYQINTAAAPTAAPSDVTWDEANSRLQGTNINNDPATDQATAGTPMWTTERPSVINNDVYVIQYGVNEGLNGFSVGDASSIFRAVDQGPPGPAGPAGTPGPRGVFRTFFRIEDGGNASATLNAARGTTITLENPPDIETQNPNIAIDTGQLVILTAVDVEILASVTGISRLNGGTVTLRVQSVIENVTSALTAGFINLGITGPQGLQGPRGVSGDAVVVIDGERDIITNAMRFMREGYGLDFTSTGVDDVTIGVEQDTFALKTDIENLTTHSLTDWPRTATELAASGTILISDAALGIGQPNDEDDFVRIAYNTTSRRLFLIFDSGYSPLTQGQNIVKVSGSDVTTATQQWTGHVISVNSVVNSAVIQVTSGFDYITADGNHSVDVSGELDFDRSLANRRYLLEFLHEATLRNVTALVEIDDHGNPETRGIIGINTPTTTDPDTDTFIPTLGRVIQEVENREVLNSFVGVLRGGFTTMRIQNAYGASTLALNTTRVTMDTLDSAPDVGATNVGFNMIPGEIFILELITTGGTQVNRNAFIYGYSDNVDVQLEDNRIVFDFVITGVSENILDASHPMHIPITADSDFRISYAASALALQHPKATSIPIIDDSWINRRTDGGGYSVASGVVSGVSAATLRTAFTTNTFNDNRISLTFEDSGVNNELDSDNSLFDINLEDVLAFYRIGAGRDIGTVVGANVSWYGRVESIDSGTENQRTVVFRMAALSETIQNTGFNVPDTEDWFVTHAASEKLLAEEKSTLEEVIDPTWRPIGLEVNSGVRQGVQRLNFTDGINVDTTTPEVAVISVDPGHFPGRIRVNSSGFSRNLSNIEVGFVGDLTFTEDNFNAITSLGSIPGLTFDVSTTEDSVVYQFKMKITGFSTMDNTITGDVTYINQALRDTTLTDDPSSWIVTFGGFAQEFDAGVTRITAGSGISIDPTTGIGSVEISADGLPGPATSFHSNAPDTVGELVGGRMYQATYTLNQDAATIGSIDLYGQPATTIPATLPTTAGTHIIHFSWAGGVIGTIQNDEGNDATVYGSDPNNLHIFVDSTRYFFLPQLGSLGVEIQEDGTIEGFASSINFGSGLGVSVTEGVATVTTESASPTNFHSDAPVIAGLLQGRPTMYSATYTLHNDASDITAPDFYGQEAQTVPTTLPTTAGTHIFQFSWSDAIVEQIQNAAGDNAEVFGSDTNNLHVTVDGVRYFFLPQIDTNVTFIKAAYDSAQFVGTVMSTDAPPVQLIHKRLINGNNLTAATYYGEITSTGLTIWADEGRTERLLTQNFIGS